MAVEVGFFGVSCGVGAQQGRDIPNPLNEHGLTVLTNGLDDGFALIAIPADISMTEAEGRYGL